MSVSEIRRLLEGRSEKAVAHGGGWMKVRAVMDDAGIKGIQATPKGLRHSFGINAVQKKMPLNLVQKMARSCATANYRDLCKCRGIRGT